MNETLKKHFPNGIGLWGELNNKHKEKPIEMYGFTYNYRLPEEITTIRPELLNKPYGKYEGELYGCPIYSNEDIPKGELHFYDNDKFSGKIVDLKEPNRVSMTTKELRHWILCLVVGVLCLISWVIMLF